MKAENFTAEELKQFREVQTLAYACATNVAERLEEGMTEKEVVQLMDAYMRSQGVTTYFHQPFAWFGDRTAFSGWWTPLHFFPTSRRLEEGMPVILDVAPVVNGVSADIGYAVPFGSNPIQEQLIQDLACFRTLILEEVQKETTFQKIYQKVDILIKELGYENCHQKYPQQVLAHRVGIVKENRMAKPILFGFGVQQLNTLVKEVGHTFLQRRPSPFWNGRNLSNHPPAPGIWAVEPHIGFKGAGAKWEELLVISENDAFWLDEKVPHVLRWQRNSAIEKQPSINVA